MSEPVVHLIDDDDAIRESLSFALEMNDLPARTYASALEFLRLAETLTSASKVPSSSKIATAGQPVCTNMMSSLRTR